MSKSVAMWIGIALTVLGIVGTGLHSAADYGALAQRMSDMESRTSEMRSDREKDRAEIKTILLTVTRMCAVTPGCRE